MTIDKNSLKDTSGTLLKQGNLNNGSSADMPLTPKSVQKSQKIQTSISMDLRPLLEIWTKDVEPSLRARGTTPKYSTGLTDLDEIIWGLHKREMLTIGARTSQGKSAFALQLAVNIADIGQRVVYFSSEMSKEQLLERIFANINKVDSKDLRRGKANIPLDRYGDIFKKLISEWKLLIDDKYGYNFNTIRQVCDLIKPDFIFVDYIQMVSMKGFKSKLEAIEENVRKLKHMASEKNLGVILISQINRQGDTNMTMAHLKGAGVLEEHSDSIILLHDDWENDKFIIKVAKQRHGICKTLEAMFLRKFLRIEEKSVVFEERF